MQAFQLGEAKQATCYHQSTGSPLKSLIFELEGEKYACYSKWVVAAMRDILKEFPRLRLHNRVAILGPSAHRRWFNHAAERSRTRGTPNSVSR